MRKKCFAFIITLAFFTVIGLRLNYALWSQKLSISNQVTSGGLDFYFQLENSEMNHSENEESTNNQVKISAFVSEDKKELYLSGIDLTPILFQSGQTMVLNYTIADFSQMISVSPGENNHLYGVRNDLGYITCTKLSENSNTTVSEPGESVTVDFTFPETISSIHAYNQVTSIEGSNILHGEITLINEQAIKYPQIMHNNSQKTNTVGLKDQEEIKVSKMNGEKDKVVSKKVERKQKKVTGTWSGSAEYTFSIPIIIEQTAANRS